ncbi:MAG: DUF364 domain-containing protein [Chloroflexota bacterium]|nr:DUF364 domain-containing protein [Chloroflexota bacterium]
MKILDDLIASLKEDSPVREVYAGVMFTAVISRNCGLATTFRDGHPQQALVRGAGSLRGQSARELAQYAQSDSLLEASIGMAAINSLIDIDEAGCIKENAVDTLLSEGKNRDIAIIGHFPWVDRLKPVARNLWVFDREPRDGDLPAEAAAEILPRADIVGITGTTLINHTAEKLLSLCRHSLVIMIGPTCPLSPVLFDYGVDIIAGTRVVDTEQAVRCLNEGAMFQQIRGVERVSLKR